MNYYFHPAAFQEYSESTRYYFKISPSLARAFVAEIESSINHIIQFSQSWQEVDTGVRRYLIKRFPFDIYYTVEDDNSVIIQAVMHLSRNPGYWKTRLE